MHPAASAILTDVRKTLPPKVDPVQFLSSEHRAAPCRQPAIAPNGLIFREDLRYVRCRRAFDVIAAIFALALSAPILFFACLAILVEDGGPVLFRQRRVGRFGRTFVMYKLRTMRKEKCGDRLAPSSCFDPRITRIGQWLRRSSVDELPQLVNVIRGDMAFVGPRPEMPFVVRSYEDWQNLRHLVTPGITGLWQVTCRKSVPMHLPEATMLDLEYVCRASQGTDFMLLVKTLGTLICTQGAF
jgi:lipopolysaccharide/colanic/teichoic acid biosynthesis glycosyltransferase